MFQLLSYRRGSGTVCNTRELRVTSNSFISESCTCTHFNKATPASLPVWTRRLQLLQHACKPVLIPTSNKCLLEPLWYLRTACVSITQKQNSDTYKPWPTGPVQLE
jgi:hypothetical protein